MMTIFIPLLLSVAKLLEKKDKPPRTYCDICELFDQVKLNTLKLLIE